MDNPFKFSRHLNDCNCKWCSRDAKGSSEKGGDEPAIPAFSHSSNSVNTQLDVTNNTSAFYIHNHTSDTSGHSDDYSFIEAWAPQGEGHCSLNLPFQRRNYNGSVEPSINVSWPSQRVPSEESCLCDRRTQSISISGSLLNDDSSEVDSNYSLHIEGATLDNGHNEVEVIKDATASHGLHKLWGVTFMKGLQLEARPDCQIIDHSDMAKWIQQAHREAAKHDKPNYLGARVQVVSNLNISLWRSLLAQYKYSRVVDYLQFGFPIGLDYDNFTYNQQADNHASANSFPEAVDEYIQTEIKHKALVGPFHSKPFERTHVSPMMTRSKPDATRRLIVDLSWPLGNSVNSRIPDNYFDNTPCSLKYPTIDHIVQRIVQVGDQALIFKIDLKRAYRNLRTDPRDFTVLGLSWRGAQYIDVSVPFGLKTGACACQLVTDSVTHLLAQTNYWTCAYLDDIIGVSHPNAANSAFLSLKNLITSLGLPINPDKVSPPTHELTCLGIHINARTKTLTIPEAKMSEVKQLCDLWSTRTHASRKDLQKLIGHLLYLHRCIEPSRLFVNRILQVLRNCPPGGKTQLKDAFFRDIQWFRTFMHNFNGITKIHDQPNKCTHLYVDACLTGIGAFVDGQVYHHEIPYCYRLSLTIVHFEMLNVMVALRLWGESWTNATVKVHCDNAAVVSILNSGSSRDPFLAAAARTLWLIKAQYNIKLIVTHIRGTDNTYADILSRWSHFKGSNSSVVQFLTKCRWNTIDVNWLQPNFNI